MTSTGEASRKDEASDSASKETAKDHNGPGKGSRNPEDSSSTATPTLKRASTTPLLSTTTSASASPRPSREGSPVRPPLKPGTTAGSRATTRSRKNSQELSPVRAPNVAGPSIPTVPSAAAIQRALSAAGTPHLPAPTHSDAGSEAQRTHKPGKTHNVGIPRTGSSTLRVSSPPPSASSGSNVLTTARKIDQSQSTPSTPSIVVERPTRSSTFASDSDATEDDIMPRSGMRTPVRGISGNGPALETVQESSLPVTPAVNTGRKSLGSRAGGDEQPRTIEENRMEEAFENEVKAKPESGNESAGNKSADAKSAGNEKKATKPAATSSSSKPPVVQLKKSYTQMPVKGKTASEGSVKNMTVETETVSSIPQVALGGGAGERSLPGRTDTGGSLRLKLSNETIRPKKDKKRVARKTPSLNSGTGGSSSRHFHHHHLHSRPPSTESFVSLSMIPLGSVYSNATGCAVDTSFQRSIDRRDYHNIRSSAPVSPSNSHGPLRHSSTVLTPFRGRSASSKADIFEAKVASAVDEANSSDSEETFVYESNPPEPLSARPHRFHSRTPSATSTVSQIDYHKNRQDGHHSVVGKKSMKFANNYNSLGYANEGDGTVRGPSQNGRGHTAAHHHIGRYGRGGHTSLFDNESPFPNANKGPRSATSHISNSSPRNSTPRSPHVLRVSGNPRKTEEVMSYDLEGEGADDERTPLVGSIRTGRNRRRPLPGSVRQMYTQEERGHPFCGRVTAFISLGSVLAILVAAIIAILILCTKPLIDVHIKDIRNVLASEQEIMLDLYVHAINPNLVAVQVSNLDINIFAKSRHVGTSELWRTVHSHSKTPATANDMISTLRRPPFRTPADIVSQLDGVDEGTDPIDDPNSDSQTMLLGQIFEFDSPLIFEPSPIRHRSLGSVGEVRLAEPGNRTEEGGTLRWEHVLQHDFELIVRGVMRYTSPVSSRTKSANIGGSVVVHPSKGVNDVGSMKVSHPTKPFDPENNVLLDESGKSMKAIARFRA